MAETRLTILGGGGVGKSALTIRYSLGHYVDAYDPTVEDFYRKGAMVDSTASMLLILDTAGQEQYSMMRDSWMRAGDAFFLVFDVSSRSSFDELDEFAAGICRVKDKDTCDSIPTIVVANKCDIESREVGQEEAQEKARSLGCAYCEASAKTATGVEHAFEMAVREHRRIKAETEDRNEPVSRRRFALIKQCTLL